MVIVEWSRGVRQLATRQPVPTDRIAAQNLLAGHGALDAPPAAAERAREAAERQRELTACLNAQHAPARRCQP